MVIENKEEKHTGIVKWYNNLKGFGIILEKKTNEEIFVHYSDIPQNTSSTHIILEENEEISFTLETKDNKICAKNVMPVATTFKTIKTIDINNPRKQHNGNNNNSRKHNTNAQKRTRNTTDFTPSHDTVDMRLMIGNGNDNKYNREITTRDVILVKNMFDTSKNIYSYLKKEIDASGLNMEDLWKSWHGDTHYIADDKLDWKDKCPTFKYVLDKIALYFDMEIKATRLNFYSDSNEWKPFHHDAAAIKKDKAKTQNFTVAISFGLEREIAFQHATHGTVISIPAENGSVYTFSRDVNIVWKHGVRQIKESDYQAEGRFSIIAWGWRDMQEA